MVSGVSYHTITTSRQTTASDRLAQRKCITDIYRKNKNKGARKKNKKGTKKPENTGFFKVYLTKRLFYCITIKTLDKKPEKSIL